MIIVLIVGLALILVGAFFFWASYSISGGVYLRSLCRGHGLGRAMMLTFDDGVDERLTPEVLKVLKRYDIKAAFFVIGEKAERNPDILRQIVRDGHVVGNHTYSHRGSFPMMRCGAMVEELRKTDEVIEKITGGKVRFFRPPFGVTNPMVACAVKRMGYVSVGWSIRSLDTTNRTREWVLKRVEKRFGDGAVILLHDDRANSPELLESIIKSAIAREYRFVGMEEMFNEEL